MSHFFNQEFWNGVLEKLIAWTVSELPSILVITLILILLLKFIKAFTRRINTLLITRSKRNKDDDTAESEKRINTLTSILRGIGKILLWTTYLMIIIRKVGVDIAPILAGAGIIGLAVGFGAQELVRDFISGFFMLLENQIRTGDVVIINGTSGLVEKIELRTTTLRDFSGTIHIFQNGKINTLSNMTKEWSAIALDIGVSYKEDLDKVIAVMQQVGADLKNEPLWNAKILEPIEVLGLDSFGSSALVIKARLKTKPNSQWEVGREYRRRLKIAFDHEGIEMPFPHTTIYWGEKIKPLKISSDQPVLTK